jgi:hypothetical protein
MDEIQNKESSNIPLDFQTEAPCAFLILSVHAWFRHPNNTWWKVQSMEFLILQFSSVSCYLFR